ncbi:MAG: V-type ATP synthase subunit D, partial [Alkalispirochaeta sp.]
MVKLTKNELKKQKDALKRFQRYLPTLQLKKQQLQMVIRQVEQEYD